MTEWFSSLSPVRKALLQGQWISILIAGTGIFASILSDTHPSTNFPLFMNSCNYILLATYLLRRYITHGTKRTVTEENSIPSSHIDTADVLNDSSHSVEHIELDETSRPLNKNNILWWYVFAAVLDVEANYLVLLAYNYTTITSVMLLDCFTIPVAMVLSYLFLGCRYNYMHILGTIICLLGLTCIVINDSVMTANSDDAPEGSNPILGDILCLSSAVLYASSNVLQEHLVKFHDREEFLGYLGCFGFSIAVVQCLATDLAPMRRAHYCPKVIGAMSGFVVCLFLMYTNTTSFLQHGDAVLFNLSLLTSDVYAVIFTYFFHGYLVSWLYFVAFALVMLGLIIYHSQEAPLHIGRDLGDIGMFALIQEKVCSMWCCSRIESNSGKATLLRVSGECYNTSLSHSYVDCSVTESSIGSDSLGGYANTHSSHTKRSGKAGVQFNPLADQEETVYDECA